MCDEVISYYFIRSPCWFTRPYVMDFQLTPPALSCYLLLIHCCRHTDLCVPQLSQIPLPPGLCTHCAFYWKHSHQIFICVALRYHSSFSSNNNQRGLLKLAHLKKPSYLQLLSIASTCFFHCPHHYLKLYLFMPPSLKGSYLGIEMLFISFTFLFSAPGTMPGIQKVLNKSC